LRATAATDAPGSIASATIRRFSSFVRSNRRAGVATAVHAQPGTGVMGMIAIAGIHLDPEGSIQLDGDVRLIAMGDIGAGSEIEVDGSVNTFTAGVVGDSVGISIGGNLGMFAAASIGPNVGIDVNGNITTIRTTTGGLSAWLTADGAIGGVYVGTGNLVGGLQAGGTAGIGTVSVSNGDLDADIAAWYGGISNIVVNGSVGGSIASYGRLNNLKVQGGTALQPRTIDALFNVFSIGSLLGACADLTDSEITVWTSLTSLSVQNITNSTIVAGSIGNIVVARNLTGSEIVAGYGRAVQPSPIGPHWQEVAGITGNIGVISIGGNMSRSSIAANIDPGPDGWYGTADDGVLSDELYGRISIVNVRGTLTGSTNPREHYGIVAHLGINAVSVSGRLLPLPVMYGNITIAPYWR
jgi:hypothetical protein